jgi:14-3-3 protein epsilon
MRSDVDDLVFFCNLFNESRRDSDAISSIHDLIALDPVFDRQRRKLFHAIYTGAIDSIQDTLTALALYEDSAGVASIVATKRAELAQRLITYCRDALGIIDDQLLPNAISPQATVFFERMKGDLLRHVAEFADDPDAGSAAEDSYTRAFAIADVSLASYDPVRLALVLNAAVFKVRIRRDVETAIDMLDRAVRDFDQETVDLSEAFHDEVVEIVSAMRGHLAEWGE